MFKDCTASEFHAYEGINVDGEKYSSQFELATNDPWFYLELINLDESSTHNHHVLFCSSINQLVLLHEDPKISILSVCLVSPDYLNRSSQWKMEPLLEIRECTIQRAYSQFRATVFKLADGRFYIDAEISDNELKYLDGKLIFSHQDQ